MLMYAFSIRINHIIHQTEDIYLHFSIRLKIMMHIKDVNY